jgi:hypothetical protein
MFLLLSELCVDEKVEARVFGAEIKWSQKFLGQCFHQRTALKAKEINETSPTLKFFIDAQL